MKVKIGNRIYDSEQEPIMLIFSGEADRIGTATNISNMKPGCTKYCICPDRLSLDEALAWMEED